jgi:hypothetical protein
MSTPKGVWLAGLRLVVGVSGGSFKKAGDHRLEIKNNLAPQDLSGGLWALRIAGIAGTRAWWSRACLRTTALCARCFGFLFALCAPPNFYRKGS